MRAASVASVHEKSVRHGHLSTLHIWPARRPLAASRAALIASLLPDPGTKEAREELLARIGGVVKRDAAGKERVEGGILAWGRETDPDLANFRDLIRAAYGGRAPKVLDPFAGGGAIPLEAMRMGCEAYASDINPVAWFIEKCTLEYPQRFAGVMKPLPDFVWEMPELVEDIAKARARRRGISIAAARATLFHRQSERKGGQQSLLDSPSPPTEPAEGDLSEHVRAWGAWVHRSVAAKIAHLYPSPDGETSLAYLWARTVKCKSCGGTIPLIKSRWVSRVPGNFVRLLMHFSKLTDQADIPDQQGVFFTLDTTEDLSLLPGPMRKLREHDLGRGTMSKSGVTCPHSDCGTIVSMVEIKREARAGRLGLVMSAVVTSKGDSKKYRAVTHDDIVAANACESLLHDVYKQVPFGIPMERTPDPSGPKNNGSVLPLYGQIHWKDAFLPRQLIFLAYILLETRVLSTVITPIDPKWTEAICSYLTILIGKCADRSSQMCVWDNTHQTIGHTFSFFMLPFKWDFVEASPLSDTSGGYQGAYDWVARFIEANSFLAANTVVPVVSHRSATQLKTSADEPPYDLIITDPPYYAAIPYSNIMDFFHIWYRRALADFRDEHQKVFSDELGPKWNHTTNDGELVDDPARFDGVRLVAKKAYEDGMTRAFEASRASLALDGRMVVVFASKEADAWETLTTAIIRSGFLVTASWPIETEMVNRMTTLNGAGLASSVWLVCRPRSEDAQAGWEQPVIDEMRATMPNRLRELWDLGIRGPDLVWAATGPALEVYSRHPFVRRAGAAGARFGTGDFLREARRVVVDFAVGRLLRGEDGELAESLDAVTSYYLLHRNDFGTGPAPSGACILYATSCGVTQSELEARFDLLARSGGRNAAAPPVDEEDGIADWPDDGNADVSAQNASDRVVLALKPWHRRIRPGLGESSGDGAPPPMIDLLHKLMQLWKAGQQGACDALLETYGLRGGDRFAQLAQAVVELSGSGSEERSLCESLTTYLRKPGTGGGGLPRAVPLHKPTWRELQTTFDEHTREA